MAKKGRRGRPVTGKKRDQTLLLRLREDEKAAFKAAADRVCAPLAVWIRMQLTKAAKEGSE